MKKKTSLQLISVYSPLLITIFFACTLLQTGCNNVGGQTKETPQQEYSDHWITMTITFKPNTNAGFREKAIRDIEEMWLNEATPFTKKDKNLFPSICVTRFSPLDTLKYRLSLLSTHFNISPTGEPQPMKTMKATPPCPPCPGLCPACDTSRTRLTIEYNVAKMVFEEQK